MDLIHHNMERRDKHNVYTFIYILFIMDYIVSMTTFVLCCVYAGMGLFGGDILKKGFKNRSLICVSRTFSTARGKDKKKKNVLHPSEQSTLQIKNVRYYKKKTIKIIGALYKILQTIRTISLEMIRNRRRCIRPSNCKLKLSNFFYFNYY